IGFILAPPNLVADMSTSLRVDCWSISPLSALVATRLIESGKAADLVAAQRHELRTRQATPQRPIAALEVRSGATAPHAWLMLPDAWRDANFCQQCLANGVAVLPGSAFSIDPERAPNAVRINLSAAPTREQLDRALKVIARLASSG